MDNYKMIDADYAFVGLKSDLSTAAFIVADTLRGEGLRVGFVMLEEATPVRPEIAHLLAGVLALGIIEPISTRSQITSSLLEVLQTAVRATDWYFPRRMPRVYSVALSPGNMEPRRAQLVDLAKAMRVHSPDLLNLAQDEVAAASGRSSHPRLRAVESLRRHQSHQRLSVLQGDSQ